MIMEHPFLVAGIVLVSFIALAQPSHSHSYKGGYKGGYKGHGQSHKGHGYRSNFCYRTAAPGDSCDTGKYCQYNKRQCPNYPGCRLICTDNAYKLCYGIALETVCGSGTPFECLPDMSGRLACIDGEATT